MFLSANRRPLRQNMHPPSVAGKLLRSAKIESIAVIRLQESGRMMPPWGHSLEELAMDKRREQRMRTFKSARILLNQHHSVISCTVRNMSPRGACLRVASPVGIPECFDVMFDTDHSVRPCRLIWHKEHDLGVEFA
jgi:hypothetical protein